MPSISISISISISNMSRTALVFDATIVPDTGEWSKIPFHDPRWKERQSAAGKVGCVFANPELSAEEQHSILMLENPILAIHDAARCDCVEPSVVADKLGFIVKM